MSKTYKCSFCEYTSSKQSNILRHEKRKHKKFFKKLGDNLPASDSLKIDHLTDINDILDTFYLFYLLKISILYKPDNYHPLCCCIIS